MVKKLNKAKVKVNQKVKKKKWEAPKITEVDILHRDLMEEFGSGVVCHCSTMS